MKRTFAENWSMKTSGQKHFELRGGEQVLARLVQKRDGEIELAHDLTEVQLRMLPNGTLFDESGARLQIKNGVEKVEFHDARGTKLVVRKDNLGLLAVRDPKAVAGLRVKSQGRGATPGHKDIGRGYVLELGPFEKLRIYSDRVVKLCGQVTHWMEGSSVEVVPQQAEVNESIYGTYHLPSLEFRTADGGRIANLTPIAASVVAADGLVKLTGPLDNFGLVYLSSGGPQINVSRRNGGSSNRTSRPLFEGVTDDGWYWISNARLSEVRRLDKALFKKMLRAVSDVYEI
jgi:hypothetical protein